MTTLNKTSDIIAIIESHNIEALRHWLANGGDPNQQVGKGAYKISPLQHVMLEMDGAETDAVVGEMLQLLIDQGADVNEASQDICPILCAVSEKRSAIVKILVDAKVNINVRDKEGATPLTSAVIDENAEILELLLQNTDRNTIDQIGSTWVKSPLGIAFLKCNLQLIEMLLKHGADPYLKDFDNLNKPMIENLPNTITIELKNRVLQLVEKYAWHSDGTKRGE